MSSSGAWTSRLAAKARRWVARRAERQSRRCTAGCTAASAGLLSIRSLERLDGVGLMEAMHCLQRSMLKSARAWRLKMALRQVCAQARRHASIKQAGVDLGAWLSWARRSRLPPFKRLAATRFAAALAWQWT